MATRESSDRTAEFSREILEQAAIWHARMRAPDAATRAGFERWLRADRLHAAAYEEIERTWEALAKPAALLLAEEPTVRFPMRRMRRRHSLSWLGPRMAAAAIVLALFGLGIGWQSSIVDNLRSDHVASVGERVPVDLADGSRIVLNTDTAITVELEPDRRTVRLLRGEAWFEVASDEDRPFIVETPAGSVRVTGTQFDVRLDADEMIVALAEGSVDVATTESRQPMSLRSGQQVRVSSAGVSKPVAFDRTAATAWRRGQLVFYDTPLSDVVAELNRYRRGRIVLANDALRNLKVSGVFSTDRPEDALDVIAQTLRVRLTRLTDYLVFLL